MELVCARVRTLLTRDHALVEVAGGERSQVIEALLGAAVLAPSLAASVTIRLRRAPAFTFQARWPDGRVEAPPQDERPAERRRWRRSRPARARDRGAALADERLRDASRATAEARARVAAPAPAPTPSAPVAIVAERSWLRRMVARLAAVRARAVRTSRATAPPPAMPRPRRRCRAPPPDCSASKRRSPAPKRACFARGRARRVTPRPRQLRRRPPPSHPRAHRRAHRQPRARLDRAPRRRARGAGRHRAGAAPAGGGGARDSEPVDATLFADATRRRRRWPTIARPSASSVRCRAHRSCASSSSSAGSARSASRAASSPRSACAAITSSIHRRARAAYEERTRELAARRVDDRRGVRREEASAQLPIARHADETVQSGAARLEPLLHEVRAAWESASTAAPASSSCAPRSPPSRTARRIGWRSCATSCARR